MLTIFFDASVLACDDLHLISNFQFYISLSVLDMIKYEFNIIEIVSSDCYWQIYSL